MQEEVLRLQQTLKTDLEAKDTASRMRISNFYKTGIGKMEPETFYCIKNANRGRDINLLRHEGAEVTDPDQIVAIMQAWYERTAERALPQTKTLTDFLARHHTDLPQIEDDQKEALEEEFSVDEVKCPGALRSDNCFLQTLIPHHAQHDDKSSESAGLSATPVGR
jgi:hypothetical protein